MASSILTVLLAGWLTALCFIISRADECDLPGKAHGLPPSEPETMSELFYHLWRTDNNSLSVGKHYRINPQGHARKEENYNAADSLFSWVDEKGVFNRTTYKILSKLLTSYKKDIGACESYGNDKLHDISKFLDAVYATPVMQKVHRYLARKKYVPANEAAFKKLLFTMWFELYQRTPSAHLNCPDTCAFEHVFIGEVKGPKVIGLHNWINFYKLEKQGDLNYHGRFQIKKEGDCMGPSMISVKFAWGKESQKPKTSMFLGTSPEFEFALFTAAYMTIQAQGGESIVLARNPYEVNITCFNTFKRSVIGSCYLEFY